MIDKNYLLKSDINQCNLKVNYNEELNPGQYKVVTQSNGPSLVLAGAGSGKTRTLVYRVIYLLEQGVKPENILLVTFTNKAAREMLERIELILGDKAKGLWGGTFHHIGNRLLRIYGSSIGINNNFTILDETDSLALMKSCLSEINVSQDKFFPKVQVIKSIVSLSVNLCQSLKEVFYERYFYLKSEYLPYIEIATKIYHQRKNKINALDFDDLLWQWNRLLLESEEVKHKLIQKFKYILVDEYQDTNYLQNSIIFQLAYPQGNILVVGDDAQSIYSFRGADVKNILQFPKNFKDSKIFKLDINYRSSQEILALANYSINKNNNKFEKKLVSTKKSGKLPVIAALIDNYQQAEFICQKILELQKKENIKLNEIAVLFRSHFLSLEIEMQFNKFNIPYQMRGGLKFFEQAHLKDISAFLRILVNYKDEVAWLRLLTMQEGIGETIAEKIWQQIYQTNSLDEVLNSNFNLSTKAIIGWNNLVKIFKKIKEIDNNNLSNIVRTIINSDYGEYLKSNYDNYQDRIDDLNQLISFIASYENLDKFLSDIALAENFKGDSEIITEKEREAVILSTIHQAKGLEWKIVFVVGLTDGQFPHIKIYDHPEMLEEERRLFYVAVTRAKDQLYLTYPMFGKDNILKVSPFIKELPSHLYEYYNMEDKIIDNEEIIYIDENQEFKKKRKILNFDPNF